MHIDLNDQLRRFVEERVASGKYASPSEVIRAGLRLLEEDEQWRDEIREKIARGVAQAKAGQLIDGDDVVADVFARINRHREQGA